MKLSRPILFLLLAAAAALGVVVFIASQRDGERDRPCEVRDFEGSRFTVCTFERRRQDLRLVSRDAEGDYMRGFDQLITFLGPDAARVRFAMNAGMFNDDGAPIGLYIADGEQQHALSLTDGPGNFHLKPNGVFWQSADGAVHVDTSEDYAIELRDARWATQSGPMLVIDGELHPSIAHDGASRYVRNGVGLADGDTAYFVISSGVVSFGRFARFFRDELRCRDALFFDGTVSSLWTPSLERQDDNHRIGPMVVVLNRD